MNEKLWEKCVQFHGHECPGLAIGYKVCEAAIKKMGITFSKDEEIVCITENDACCVDAVQVITGCTFGKGNIIYRDTGKMAFSFFNRSSGEKIRIVLKPSNSNIGMDREQRKKYILSSNVEEIFNFSIPNYELPEKAKIFKAIICEKCGEGVPEHKIRLSNGKMLCRDCYKYYTRGW